MWPAVSKSCALWGFFASFLFAFGGIAVAGWPTELQVAFEESWEAFCDGRYDDALRLSDKCKEWIGDSANKKVLSDLGFDWFLVEAKVMALQAEALAKSDQDIQARNRLRLAQSRLQTRRASYLRRGVVPVDFLLTEAGLCVVEGDLDRPLTDFGMAEQFVGAVCDAAKKRGDPSKAERSYRKGLDILERKLQLSVNDFPDAGVADGPLYEANRLMIWLLVRLARSETEKFGLPTKANLDDAAAYLIRAEELHANNFWWKEFFAPSAPNPVSYYQIQEAAESKLQSVSGKVNEQLPRERLIVLMKKVSWDCILDGYKIMCARAEVEGQRELQRRQSGGVQNTPVLPNAELAYKRACTILRAQFRPAHPMLGEVEASNAKWFIVRANPSLREGAKLSREECLQMVSFCRDCLYLVARRRASEPRAIATRQWELNFLELRALDTLMAIDAQALDPFLTERQKGEVQQRREFIRAEQLAVAPRL
jgi:hypothetical protein